MPWLLETMYLEPTGGPRQEFSVPTLVPPKVESSHSSRQPMPPDQDDPCLKARQRRCRPFSFRCSNDHLMFASCRESDILAQQCSLFWFFHNVPGATHKDQSTCYIIGRVAPSQVRFRVRSVLDYSYAVVQGPKVSQVNPRDALLQQTFRPTLSGMSYVE